MVEVIAETLSPPDPSAVPQGDMKHPGTSNFSKGRHTMGSPENAAQQVLAESQQLYSYLTSLSQEALLSPSACEGWQVGDVIAHLVGSAHFYHDSVTRGLAGDSAAPEGRSLAGSQHGASAAERILKGTLTARERLGDQLLPAYEEHNTKLNQLFRSIQGADWDKPSYHLGGTFPARTFINMRMMELAIHGWDIRSVLEPPAALSEDAMPLLLELIPSFLHWFFSPGEVLGDSLRYRFDLSGPSSTTLDIVVEGDHTYIAPPSNEQPNTTLHGSTETFFLLMFGRHTIASAIDMGLITMDGEKDFALRFNDWFRGA